MAGMVALLGWPFCIGVEQLPPEAPAAESEFDSGPARIGRIAGPS